MNDMLHKIRNKYNSLKIKTKLILLLLSTMVIPVSILGVFSYSRILKTTNTEVKNNFVSMVNQVTNNLDTILLSLPSNAELIYRNKIIQKVLGGRQEPSFGSIDLLNEIINEKISTNVNAATFLFAASGEIYTYNNFIYPDLSLDYKETYEYKKCRENNNKLIWIPTNHISIKSSVSPEYNKNMLGVALILKDMETGAEVGMLEIIVREDYIFNIYNKIKMTENTFGFIIDSNGFILSHSDKGLLGTRNEVYTGIRDLLYESNQGNITYNIDGNKYVLIYNTIPINEWKLVFAVPEKELMKYSESTKYLFIVILAICSLISVLISILVSSNVSKPIEKIVSTIVQYGKGELSVRIRDYEERTDEIGVLSRELNQMAEKITSLVREKYYNEIKLKEAELQALQAQINPHFLYNTLDTINFLAIKHHIPDISSIAVALGDLMRLSIRKDVNTISIKEEINYVRNYMTIQKIRFKDKLSIEYRIDEDIYRYKIPKLTLQPLVENAIVHGIEKKMGNGNIIISGFRDGDYLIISVSDDGVGLDEDHVNRMLASNLEEYAHLKDNILSTPTSDSKKGGSIGLRNVDMRIKLMFGSKYGLRIRSEAGQGTTVKVVLPFIENNNI